MQPGGAGSSRSVLNDFFFFFPLAETSIRALQRGSGNIPGASGFVSGRIRQHFGAGKVKSVIALPNPHSWREARAAADPGGNLGWSHSQESFFLDFPAVFSWIFQRGSLWPQALPRSCWHWDLIHKNDVMPLETGIRDSGSLR